MGLRDGLHVEGVEGWTPLPLSRTFTTSSGLVVLASHFVCPVPGCGCPVVVHGYLVECPMGTEGCLHGYFSGVHGVLADPESDLRPAGGAAVDEGYGINMLTPGAWPDGEALWIPAEPFMHGLASYHDQLRQDIGAVMN